MYIILDISSKCTKTMKFKFCQHGWFFFTNDNQYIIINYLFNVLFIQALKVYMETFSQTNLCIVYEDGLNLVIIFLLL